MKRKKADPEDWTTQDIDDYVDLVKAHVPPAQARKSVLLLKKIKKDQKKSRL